MTDTSTTDAATFRQGLRVLRTAVHAEPKRLAFGTGGAVLHAMTTIAGAVVLGRITDQVIYPAFERGEVGVGATAVAVAALLAVGLLKSVGVVARRYGAYLVKYHMEARYRRLVAGRFLRLPLRWHRQHQTGELLSNAHTDVESTFQTMAPLPMSIGVIAMALVTAGLLVATDPFLAAIGFVVAPALAVVNARYLVLVRSVAAAAQRLRGDVAAVAHESVDAALVVKTLGLEDTEAARLQGPSEDLRDRMIHVGRLRAVFDPVVEALPTVGILLVLAVGAWRVDAGALTAGEVVQFAYLFNLLALPLRVFGWLLGDMPRSVVGWERVKRVLATDIEMGYGDAPADGDGGVGVAMSDATFVHHDGAITPGATARARGVQGISFDVAPGRTVAVVGPTGSGKSTVAALLVRLFDPDEGEVRFDGRNLQDLSRGAVAGSVAVVQQDPFLFDDTVWDNITLGGDFSAEEVEAAAALACADEFVSALPDGYDTRLGERGASLSSGQRQRVALARALVRRPRLLVLDDATSSVDARIEGQILDGLRDADLPSTTVIVAYRQATISMADEVVFVVDGRLAARGTHRDLLERVPAYRSLLDGQQPR